MPVERQNFRFGEFVLDVREHCLRTNGTQVHLPPKTFETLLHLVSRHGHLVTKQELLDAVWPGVSVTENVLTRCVKEIRGALGDEAQAPRFIETVTRLGYRFVAPVQPVSLEQVDSEYPGAEASGPPAETGDGRVPTPEAAVGTEPPRPRSYRRLALWIGGIVLVAALGTAGALRGRPSMPFQPRDFLLVTDLDNRTGEPLLDETLAVAFVVSLEQSPYVNVLPRSRAREVLQRMGQPADRRIDEDLGREICVREGVRGLLALMVTRVGSRYSLSARLVDPDSGRSVRSRSEPADGPDRLLPALQSLAARIRRDLGESISSIRAANRPLEQVTTPSLNALKHYTDGVSLWAKGEYAPAVELYEAAVREDPGFAKAHAAIGSAMFSHVFVFDPVRGRTHYDLALRAANRTTERERLSIRMLYEADLGHVDEAATLFAAYLRSYPDDLRARYTFATFLMLHQRTAEAIRHFEAVVAVAPRYAGAHVNLATSYGNLGRYAEALDAYRRAFEIEPGWLTRGNLNHEYGFLLVRAGQPAKAREVFERGLGSDTRAGALRSLALLDLYEGKYASARTRFGEAIEASAARKFNLNEARNRLFLALTLAGQGKRAAAIDELDRAVRAAATSAGVVWLRARIAMTYARLGSVRRAQRVLEKARGEVDPESAEQRSDVHLAESEILRALGHRDRAAAALALADAEHHSAFTAESLARAAREAGEAETAIRYYEALLGMKDGSLGFEPQQDWLAAHYWLATLHLGRGDAGRAAQALAPLLEAWRGADADLPLLRDARRLDARVGDSAVRRDEPSASRPRAGTPQR